MAKPTKTPPAPATAPAAPTWPRDRYSGQPGRYVRDADGKRQPADDVARSVAAELDAQEQAEADALNPAGTPAQTPAEGL